MTPDQHLATLLKGNPRGFTRTELAYRLRQPDRQVRQLIEDAVVKHGLPVVADRSAGKEAYYRIAGKHEIDVVISDRDELVKKGNSLFRRARHLENAWLDYHNNGSLFMPATEELR